MSYLFPPVDGIAHLSTESLDTVQQIRGKVLALSVLLQGNTSLGLVDDIKALLEVLENDIDVALERALS